MAQAQQEIVWNPQHTALSLQGLCAEEQLALVFRWMASIEWIVGREGQCDVRQGKTPVGHSEFIASAGNRRNSLSRNCAQVSRKFLFGEDTDIAQLNLLVM